MFSRESTPGQGRSGRVRPQLETLEDRCCPSAGASLLGNALTVTGDLTHPTTIAVQDNGHGGVSVKLNNGKATTYNNVQKIFLDSRGADDHIDYTLTGNLTSSETLTLNLGKGSDQVHLDYSKAKIAAPKLNINLNGGGGDEVVNAVFGAIDNTDLQLAASLGNGWDRFNAQFNGNLTGKANVNVNVQGGKGVDGVVVQAHSNIGPNAHLNVTAAVGDKANTLHVDYTGKVDGTLSITDKAGAGWDWLETHINLTPGSTGSVAAHVFGGSGADMVILTIQNAGSKLKSLDAQLHTGSTRTTETSTANVKVTKVANPPHH